MPRAFVFDLDGVVVDSLEILRDTYFNFLSKYNKQGSSAEFESLNGPSLTEIVRKLNFVHGLAEADDILFENYRSLLHAAYVDARPISGVRECLEALKSSGIFVALATSSLRSEVEEILRRHDLVQMFDFVITGDEVSDAKPSPEIYLTLQRKFPHLDFIAIEDSENGIIAACSAGLETIFFDIHKRGTQRSVSCRVTSMVALLERLREFLSECYVVEMIGEIHVKVVDNPRKFDPEMVQQVDRIWSEAARTSNLSDDTVLYYLSHETDGTRCTISVFQESYRYTFARYVQPSLDIPYPSLAVSGIVLDNDGWILVGRRRKVSEYSGRYEFVPSGSLSAKCVNGLDVNYIQQVIDEFEEESGLASQDILSIDSLGLIMDLKHRVLDIGCKIRVGGSRLKTLIATNEYSDLQWMTMTQVSDIEVIPTSGALLKLLK